MNQVEEQDSFDDAWEPDYDAVPDEAENNADGDWAKWLSVASDAQVLKSFVHQQSANMEYSARISQFVSRYGLSVAAAKIRDFDQD